MFSLFAKHITFFLAGTHCIGTKNVHKIQNNNYFLMTIFFLEHLYNFPMILDCEKNIRKKVRN